MHCDISPPNLMVSYEGEVRVIDFGIARSAIRTADLEPQHRLWQVRLHGARAALARGVIDRRTDIYAAGVVLYELLTGDRLHQFPEGRTTRHGRAVCQGKCSCRRLRRTRRLTRCWMRLSASPGDATGRPLPVRGRISRCLQQEAVSAEPDDRDGYAGAHHGRSVRGRAQHTGPGAQPDAGRRLDGGYRDNELTEAVGHTVGARSRRRSRPAAPAAEGNLDVSTTAMPPDRSARRGTAPPSSGTPSVISRQTLRPSAMKRAGSGGAHSQAAAPAMSGQAGRSMTAAVVPQDPPVRRTARWGVLAFLLVFAGGGVWWLRNRPAVSALNGGNRPIPPIEGPALAPVVENLPPPAPPPPAVYASRQNRRLPKPTVKSRRARPCVRDLPTPGRTPRLPPSRKKRLGSTISSSGSRTGISTSRRTLAAASETAGRGVTQ